MTQLDQLAQRIDAEFVSASALHANEMAAEVSLYESANLQSRTLYLIRAKGNESNENRAARLAADLAKHTHKTAIAQIESERTGRIAQVNADRAATLNPATTEEQLAEILSRYPA